MVTREELGRVRELAREYGDELLLVNIYGGTVADRITSRDDNRRLLDLLDAAGRCGREDALAEVDNRLMPEGMEWPRYRDGTKVSWEENAYLEGGRILDACDVVIALDGSCYALTDYGGDMLEIFERLERASQDSIQAVIDEIAAKVSADSPEARSWVWGIVERLRAIAARAEGEGK